MKEPIAHVALSASNLHKSFAFYEKLGGVLGRSKEGRWAILNFFGIQLVLHTDGDPNTNDFYAGHFGVIVSKETFERIATQYPNEVKIRNYGQKGCHMTVILRDPNGNWLEFKTYAEESEIY